MVLWILGAFYTSSTIEIEAIVGLIPIYLYLQKLSGRNQLQTAILSYNYVIKSLLERRHAPNSQLHYLVLENIIFKQKIKIKSSIVDINNQLNRIFTSFDSLNFEFHLGYRLIDTFHSCIFFHNTNQSSNKSKKLIIKNLIKLFSNYH